MTKLIINKVDGARRQLEVAIELFFYESDPVSIHTLSSAAFNVLQDIATYQEVKGQALRNMVLEYVKENKRSLFVAKLREAENFFKHADRDPDANLRFDSRQTEFVIFDAVLSYRFVSGEFPVVMRIFNLWFMLDNGDLFNWERAVAELHHDAVKSFKRLTRKEFFEGLLSRL